MGDSVKGVNSQWCCLKSALDLMQRLPAARHCSAKQCSILQSDSVQSSVVQCSVVQCGVVQCNQQQEWHFGTLISNHLETVISITQRSRASFIAHATTEEKEWSEGKRNSEEK
jgi:hypothetical protein